MQAAEHNHPSLISFLVTNGAPLEDTTNEGKKEVWHEDYKPCHPPYFLSS